MSADNLPLSPFVTDSGYQLMPALLPDEFEYLKADIQAHGVRIPIEVDEHHNVLDGHHRVRACYELDIKEIPAIVRAGLTEPQKRAHIRALNLARRHLNQEQRRALIEQQLRESPEASDRKVAKDLGVDHGTVGTVRDQLQSTGEIPQLEKRVGADGRKRANPKTAAPSPSPSPTKSQTTSTVVAVPDIPRDECAVRR